VQSLETKASSTLHEVSAESGKLQKYENNLSGKASFNYNSCIYIIMDVYE